jgi:hypothetical protein
VELLMSFIAHALSCVGRVGFVVIGLACLAATGCSPVAFEDLRDEAPIFALERPSGYPRLAFGSVLTAFGGELAGVPVSRVAVNAGPSTPILVFPGWTPNGLGLGPPLYDLCDDTADCDAGTGMGLVGVPRWRAGTPGEGEMCVFATSAAAGTITVRCESNGGTVETLRGGLGEGFGASIATSESVQAVAVVGAPDAFSGAGRVWRVADAMAPEAIELPADTAPAGGRLGSAVAASALGSDALVAASAPDAGRVVVLVQGPTAADVSVRACIDDPIEGFGGALAFGDVTGDGRAELFIGSAGSEVVRMYDGASLPDPGGCGPWGSPPVDIVCPQVRGVSCGSTQFGASLAVGDVDGDGFGDLVVGAPGAIVEGEVGAGAVYVIAGRAAGLDAGRSDVLTLSSPAADDRLGAVVGVMPSNLGDERTPRVEPVAGAPGRDVVGVFLCSALGGDTQAVGSRCVPN